MTLLYYLFLFFFFYYVVKFLVFLYVKYNKIKNFLASNNQQYENPQNPPQQEGKVTLEKTKSSTKTKSDNVGDYIDFEEVEE